MANALNTTTALEIRSIFDSIAHDTSCRAVVLTGGGKHFCAGADLKERQGIDEIEWRRQHQLLEAAPAAISRCPIPVIAAVNGSAFGGGLELAMACDFIYASDNARFALTETTLGIIPGLGGTQRLPRAIGLAQAKELLFTGRSFSAAEAMRLGLVNRVCPTATLLSEAVACARHIAGNAPLAIKTAKQAISDGADLSLEDALACELRHYDTLLATHDRHEGTRAFLEKRKPIFKGS